ncbi:hypothetical protein RJ640_021885 [Escallonia rubra]|uniref:Ninja-family protein n=1 Tax=Escallonia rubra TaxID=112253 RepID=A0AA88RNP4_9ASTE|nr:hypothetical protein RJ640_021885 [Escallonia rubra]
MAEAKEIGSSFPRDLLRRFINGNGLQRKFENDDRVDIELSLGLSLNGRFGVDPERANNLIRSSSIANFMSTDESTACSVVGVAHAQSLTRACSLPAETEQEWRRRKEVQSLRRMEAKRKRLEKLKNVRVVREKVRSDENGGPGVGSGSWVSGAVTGHEVDVKGGGGGDGGVLEGRLLPQPSSQGSIGSQGSGSSGISDFGSQPNPGTNKFAEIRSPASVQPLPEQIQQNQATPGTKADEASKPNGAASENPGTKVPAPDGEGSGRVSSMMADMPCLSTRGDGPDGKKIEGFLYRYRKGEDVRIVCVCHGSFLSPAEFVKHAGGGDVAYPLKHIVVNPSPIL